MPSPRLHPKGTSSRFAPRAPRRFAPRNDTSGWCRGAPAPLRGLMLLHKAVTDRHAGWPCCGIDSMARGSLNCHCEEAAGRRGNLGKAVTFSPKVSCYPPRFCEIATGAKRPRNDKSGDFTVLTIAGTGRKCTAGRGQPGPYSGAHHLTTAGTGCKCLPEIATGAKRPRNDKSGDFTVLTIAGTGCKCLPEIATGAKRPRNDNLGAVSTLTIACSDRQRCAGRGTARPPTTHYRFWPAGWIFPVHPAAQG